MNNNYEDILEYLADKVEGLEEKTWEDVCIELGIDTHPDVIRKSFNGGKYSGYNVYKYFKNKEEDSCSEDEINRLISIKQEVYKEKVRLSDQKREYLKHLRSDARYENLVNVLRYELSNIEPLKLFTCENYKNTGVSASLLLSDIHYGASSDNVLNLYNVDVCEERINELLNKTIYYCSIHRVQTLYINLLGDNISGLIHCNNRVEAEEDVVSQVIHVSELISTFISQLSKHVPEIRVVGVCGNHSRVTPNKKENINETNDDLKELIKAFDFNYEDVTDELLDEVFKLELDNLTSTHLNFKERTLINELLMITDSS